VSAASAKPSHHGRALLFEAVRYLNLQLSTRLMFLVAGHVDDYRRGKNQQVVFALCNIHAVGIGPGEPALADLCDGAPAALKIIFVIEKISAGLQVSRPGTSTVNLQRKKVKKCFFTTAASSPARVIS